MSRSRLLLALAVAAIVALCWTRWEPSASAAAPFETGKIKLYSGGQVVAEWESSGPAKLEGESLVFPIRTGVHDRQVRVHGSFSYEVQE